MHDGTNHSGFLTLEELLPEGLLDAYDTSAFQDLLGAEFDTGLLDITKQAGQDNIFNTIMGGQTSYMQVPGQASAAGASGFAGADSSRGLITISVNPPSDTLGSKACPSVTDFPLRDPL